MNQLKQHLNNLQQDKTNALSKRPNYTFHDDCQRQIDANTTTGPTSGRYYSIDSCGALLPSVTTVLGATKSQESIDALERWKKRVGEEEAERIKNEAADRGEILHNLCEHYILDSNKFKVPKEGTNAFALWKQMHPLLQRIDNIRSVEGVLYSEKLGMAGRVDCVADFDGVLSIIDFKTTVKARKKEWLQDYYCQETSYALMYSEMYNVKVKQIVTLMVRDNAIFEKEGAVYVEKTVDYIDQLLYRVRKFRTENK